jgi:pimeloyl-ACP methyl ester carboxylesterase
MNSAPSSSLPLLALPGLLLDERLWQRQAAALAPGHPITSFALTPAATIGELAAMALARAPAGRFALAGLSMGGYVALEIVRRAPERVAALALLDTSARPDTAEQTKARRSGIAASASDFDGVVRALFPRLLHPSRVGDAVLEAQLLAMARGIGREGYVRQQRAIIGRIDSRPTLTRIACPTLVLCGREDAILPLEMSEEMHAGIAGSRLVVVETCGHLSTMEQPEVVSDALREWLESARL